MKFLKVLAGMAGLKRPFGIILPVVALALGLAAAPPAHSRPAARRRKSPTISPASRR